MTFKHPRLILSIVTVSDFSRFGRVGWLLSKDIKKLVLVVLSAESRVVRERWEFDVVLMEPEVTEEGGAQCAFSSPPDLPSRQTGEAILTIALARSTHPSPYTPPNSALFLPFAAPLP